MESTVYITSTVTLAIKGGDLTKAIGDAKKRLAGLKQDEGESVTTKILRAEVATG
jgi:hypothetical protein